MLRLSPQNILILYKSKTSKQIICIFRKLKFKKKNAIFTYFDGYLVFSNIYDALLIFVVFYVAVVAVAFAACRLMFKHFVDREDGAGQYLQWHFVQYL